VRGKGRERHLLLPIVRALCDRIASRTITPGSRITEQDICSEFAVARSTAREVLATLQQRGLITRPPNRSAVVVGLSKDEILHILSIREVLDARCVRMAVENSKPEDWQEIVELFDKPMSRAVREGDWAAYLKNLEVFYRQTRKACDSAILREVLESIDDRSRYVIRRVVLLPGRMEQGIAELRKVVAAMRKGDAVLAEQLRRDNIRSQMKYFNDYGASFNLL